VDDNYKLKGVSNVVSGPWKLVKRISVSRLFLVRDWGLPFPNLRILVSAAFGKNQTGTTINDCFRNPTLTMCGYAQDLAKKLTPVHDKK
jgi:hypothetical protein